MNTLLTYEATGIANHKLIWPSTDPVAHGCARMRVGTKTLRINAELRNHRQAPRVAALAQHCCGTLRPCDGATRIPKYIRAHCTERKWQPLRQILPGKE